jgi:hypothetical protein
MIYARETDSRHEQGGGGEGRRRRSEEKTPGSNRFPHFCCDRLWRMAHLSPRRGIYPSNGNVMWPLPNAALPAVGHARLKLALSIRRKLASSGIVAADAKSTASRTRSRVGSVPCHKGSDVKRGLLRKLVRAAGMTVEEYLGHFYG